ncbi:hypothetical protein [Bosea sp. 2RAB26]|uniref:hypothetical protein n=1 Tax=Bosea sp. 2RAB26 TaxID=3237476 RepID=UPI003F8F93E0
METSKIVNRVKRRKTSPGHYENLKRNGAPSSWSVKGKGSTTTYLAGGGTRVTHNLGNGQSKVVVSKPDYLKKKRGRKKTPEMPMWLGLPILAAIAWALLR